MNTWIALFRGINVVGNHVLPMKDLKALIEKRGCIDVRTYIQSGNVIFRSAISDASRMAKLLETAVSKSHGFEPRVLVLTRSQLAQAAAANPFPQADANPKSLHLFFLAEPPLKPDLKSLDALRTRTEGFLLKGSVFYLHTPDGFGHSRLAQRAERHLGVEATARNWRTVKAILELAGAGP
jgi:uncharacterized protein (DUF1697 family)